MHAILILDGYMMALMHDINSLFYLFDPHARNSLGMSDPNGTAVVFEFGDIADLEQYLCALSSNLNTYLFEIVPVKLREISVECNQIPKTIYRPKKARKCVRRKLLKERDPKYQKNKITIETECEKQFRVAHAKNYMKRKQASTSIETQGKCKNKNKKRKCSENSTACTVSQEDYLRQFDIKNGSIHQQTWAQSNIHKFHKSNIYFITQCTICMAAWPLKCKPKSHNTHVCSRCLRDKRSPKKFSCENSMIPSIVPYELQDLSQVEEMLIARALPIMRIYIKPGGQRGYSGHCINLPQNVKELAKSLPRYPKNCL